MGGADQSTRDAGADTLSGGDGVEGRAENHHDGIYRGGPELR